MTDKINKEINDFKEKVKREAEELVFKIFPKKILNLELLSNSPKFSPNVSQKKFEINIPIPPPKTQIKRKEESSEQKSPKSGQNSVSNKNLIFDDSEELIITKPFLFPNGTVECNELFIDLIKDLKPLMMELSEDILLLKLGVSLMVPKIEDGNNFGVEIQEETINSIAAVESELFNNFDKFETYFESRGDLVVKVAKYPHNEDFRIAVRERDQKFHLNLCLLLTDLRNHYVSLHDLVTKNITKIKEPRSEDNKDFLY